jgi:two-component system alkaline phosphatase synthesis response regulator PhoP
MINEPTRQKVYELDFSELLFLYDGDGQKYQSHHGKIKDKILIVDDEELILGMYKIKLEKEGYEVITARNGEEGFIAARAQKPNLILTDIMMPKYDGFYLLKKIKSNSELKDIPVITLSNLNDSYKRQKACELGTLYFLVKSEFLPKDVADIIKEVLTIKAKYSHAFV